MKKFMMVFVGDWLYFDKFHKDHIEVFDKIGRVSRTVLNMDGTINTDKEIAAQIRNIIKWIR